ncbi:MAG: type IX secretion system outer membrane channel protein PorV [Flavobacteriaceae bacterium]|nr:type IX secretion system outer membrane channel protein PorV [Flavobacteriaceae bacterium]
MRQYILLALAFTLALPKINAQNEPNPISTAAPFLLIAPDARSGGMADMGVSSSADANSQHWNPAKYAFLESQFTLAVNYTPWLRNLTNDVFLGSIIYANRIDERSAWATSLTYFSLGSIELRQTGDPNEQVIIEQPNELAIDGSYSMRLSESFSMAVGLRYIRSDFALRVSNSDINTVNTFSVDIAGFYQSQEENYGTFNGRWRGGFNISNIGPRVSFTDSGQDNFIPTNLRLGGGFDFILDDYNTISANIELNKLLVPTPPLRNSNGDIIGGQTDDVGFFKGIFQSFSDAPGGFKEELKEFTWAIGAEYLYDDAFAIRAGYYNESDLKGARKFFTLGTGFKFRSSRIDMSYLFNASDINNPLENTLRFSLTFDFGDFFEEF